MASFYAKYPPKIVASSGPTVPYFLDTLATSSAAAYSLRQLSSTYLGKAIEVTRSSDSSAMDIGFLANGNLDTVTLLSFVGTGTGSVTIWYDQSGNARNMTPLGSTPVPSPTPPVIVQSGTLVTQNTLPAILFGGSNLLGLSASDGFALGDTFNVVSRTTTSNFDTFWGGWDSGGAQEQDLAFLTPSTTVLLLNSVHGGAQTGYGIDNINVDQGGGQTIDDTELHQILAYESTPSPVSQWYGLNSGLIWLGFAVSAFEYLQGCECEIIFYPTNLSGTLRTTGSANQKSYWSTP